VLQNSFLLLPGLFYFSNYGRLVNPPHFSPVRVRYYYFLHPAVTSLCTTTYGMGINNKLTYNYIVMANKIEED
jgi:hypothetical protein